MITFPENDLPGLADGIANVRNGHLKPSAWLEICLDRIALCDPHVKAFETIDIDGVRARALDLDACDWSMKSVPPELAGAPLGIKDIFNTCDLPTGMGSKLRQGYQPGNNARVVDKILDLGALVVGKTTTAEFAVHSSPRTENPWDRNVLAGTSSTGSAVAVACGMVPAAFGTQSAGSIIRPASYNSVVGFKPTFGLVPRTGVLKTCDTLDTIGWLTRNVRDARLLLDCLRVRGHNYPQVVRGFRNADCHAPKDRPWRIGFGPAPGMEHAKDYAIQKINELALQLGNRTDVELIDLDLSESLARAHSVHEVIYHKSLSYYFTRDLAHVDKISERFKELVDEGEQYSNSTFMEALSDQEALSAEFDKALEGVDVFLSLSTSGKAPKCGAKEPPDSSLVWTLCGAPSISLPMFRSRDHLPFGAQLVSRRYFDYILLDFAESVFPGNSMLATPDAMDLVSHG